MYFMVSGKTTIALFPKVPNTERPKALKIDVFDYPTSRLQGIPANVRINLYCQKLQSLRYVFAADSTCLS